jgi:hypothetical protein
MFKDSFCRDQNTYNQITRHLEEVFHNYWHELQKVRELALKIKTGIESINPLIQQNTQKICPDCKDVCCISKHGYYNYEDLVYIHALGLKPPDYEFGRSDPEPCQFLSEKGCSLERPFRPSGCNWYFCDSLLENIEKSPDYHLFDSSLGNIAELWLKLIEEFYYVINHRAEKQK